MKKMKKNILIFLLIIVLSLVLTKTFVFAQPTLIESVDDIEEALKNIRNILFGIASFIAVIMFIVAGILYMTAQGEPEKINKAKTAVKSAVIGTVIAVVAAGVLELIKDILK